MPMPNAITKAFNYVGQAGGLARNYGGRGFNYGAGYLGRTGMASAVGAAGGGIYGATAGRDYGQSRMSGFMSGALGGAAFGAAAHRYGPRMGRSGLAQARYGRGAATSGMERLGMGLGAAGKAGARAVLQDAKGAYQYIASGLKGNGALNEIKSTLKAGYQSRR